MRPRRASVKGLGAVRPCSLAAGLTTAHCALQLGNVDSEILVVSACASPPTSSPFMLNPAPR
jgi:hypothetical protein